VWQDRRFLWTGACVGALLVLAGSYLLILGADGGMARIDELGAAVTPDDLKEAATRAGVLLLGGGAFVGLGIVALVVCMLVLGSDRIEERGAPRE